MNAAKITSRIAALESQDLPKATTALDKAEGVYAASLAEGADSAATLKAMTAARDLVNGLLAALVQLDAQELEAASAEYAGAVAAADAVRLKAFREAESEIDSALRSVRKAFDRLVGPDAAALAASIRETSTTAVWEKLSEKYDATLRSLGRRPTKRPPRGPHGRPLTADVYGALREALA